MRGQHSVEIHFPCWPVSTIITSAADTADDPVKAESESAGTTLKAAPATIMVLGGQIVKVDHSNQYVYP